jgi:lipopolysaccharide transport system permease protein
MKKTEIKHIYTGNNDDLFAQDIINSIKNIGIPVYLAFSDIKQRYKRSIIGPFWITLSMLIFTSALGFVMANLFNQDVGQLIPYIAVSVIFWNLLSSIIIESCNVFIENGMYIKNVPCHKFNFLLRMILRNLIIAAHNFIIYIFVIAFFTVNINHNVFWLTISLPLFVLNLTWISIILSVIATRYRDITHVIVNLVQVLFFVTPVFWSVKTMPQRPAFIDYNPAFHLLEIVRDPLLGYEVHFLSWLVASIMLIPGFLVAIYIYKTALKRIVYWT